MTNFDVVEFGECRSEEGISFFWRSVYIKENFVVVTYTPSVVRRSVDQTFPQLKEVCVILCAADDGQISAVVLAD